MAEKAFEKTKPNTSYVGNQSTKTNPKAMLPTGARTGATTGKARGVEHPIPEDMALIGDTRHALHSASLAKRMHPYGEHQNAGYPESAGSLRGSDQLRVDCGDGVDGEM